MQEKIYGNEVKRALPQQHRRSRSLDAVDSLEILEAQRLFRQKYLQNRAKFERQSFDATDNASRGRELSAARPRRLSADTDRDDSPPNPRANADSTLHVDQVLRAPSLVKQVSSKYITPIHRSMLDPSSREPTPEALSRHSLPLAGGGKPTSGSPHVRRTMSAREAGHDRRHDFRFGRTHQSGGAGLGTGPSSPVAKAEGYFQRKQLYSAPSDTSDSVSSEATEDNHKKTSSLYITIRPTATSYRDSSATRSRLQSERAFNASERVAPSSLQVNNYRHNQTLSQGTGARETILPDNSPNAQEHVDLIPYRLDPSSLTSVPKAYSSYQTQLLNKTWKPVGVHRYNSFNDGREPEVSKVKDFRALSRTKSDVDKYGPTRTTDKQNFQFRSRKADILHGTAPLVSSSNGKVVVKAREETLPATVSVRTQFRKFNLSGP